MGLTEYNKKRKFGKTPEPEGKTDAADKRRFVVQEHHASRLHYDFRMEAGGTLKSWAVPKGPSMNPSDKRLAVMTEDHPVKYLIFEGTIPEGNYGAGEMSIWDSGTYEMAEGEGSYEEGLKNGKLKFTLFGEKLKGAFSLVEMQEKKQWLLIKSKDEFAGQAVKTASKKKSRTRKTDSKSQGELKADYIKPMLARLSDKPFDDKKWIFEAKLDGYRAIAEVKDGTVLLYSRTGKSYEKAYAPIVRSLKKIPHEAVLDGEIVVLNDHGNPDFNLLQLYKSSRKGPLKFYVFDLLHLNGEDTTGLPLLQRKELLKSLVEDVPDVIFSEHSEGRGEDFFKLMEKEGLEGMMAKKADSQYFPGARTGDWLKIKVQNTADAIIGGFTEATDSREFGALVLGMLDEQDKLRFVGHCGTGFTREEIKEMRNLFRPLEQGKSPFAEKTDANAKVTWLSPELVCEVAFTEWTKAGLLRHPSFKHMRTDKPVTEVRLSGEKNYPMAATSKPTGKKGKKKTPENIGASSGKTTLEIGKSRVQLTSLDKVYFPESGITKGEILDYYIQVSDYMLPYLKDRAESLHRFPEGLNGQDFYQKDINFKVPDYARIVPFYSDSAEKEIDWLVCDNLETLLFMVNLGTIEINPWNSTVKKPGYPTYAAIDLDPGDKTDFSKVVETALVIKEILDQAEIPSVCKTSGSRGLHIFIPLNARYEYDKVRDFVKSIMMLTHHQLPKITSLERSPSARRSKIYLDYLQNKEGQTLVAPYSVRPREGATVSTPLEWEAVNENLNIRDFTIHTVPERLKEKGDLWKPVLGKGIDMQKALKKLIGD